MKLIFITLFFLSFACVDLARTQCCPNDSVPQASLKSRRQIREERKDSLFLKKYRFTPPRHALLALGLSLLVPGAGQLYNKQYGKAGFYFVSEGLLFTGLFVAVKQINRETRAGDRVGVSYEFLVPVAALLGLEIAQLIDAPIAAGQISMHLEKLHSGKTLSFRVEPDLWKNQVHGGNTLVYALRASNYVPGVKLILAF